MDASRKALKAGLQINNKAAMQVQAEAIVHPPVITSRRVGGARLLFHGKGRCYWSHCGC